MKASTKKIVIKALKKQLEVHENELEKLSKQYDETNVGRAREYIVQAIVRMTDIQLALKELEK